MQLLETSMVEPDDICESNSYQPFQCFYCETSFEALNELTWHIAEIHESNKTFICNICSAEFLEIEDLEKHNAGHYVKVHSDDTTPKKKVKSTVKKAKKAKKVKEVKEVKKVLVKEHICNICNKKFVDISSVKRHVKEVHDEVKPYLCDRCDKCFSRERELKNHIKIVHEGERPHVCDTCSARFTKTNHLNTHIAAVHEKTKKHNCDLCEYR